MYAFARPMLYSYVSPLYDRLYLNSKIRIPIDMLPNLSLIYIFRLVIHVYNYLRSKISDVSDSGDSVMYDNVNGYDHDVLINSISKKPIMPSSMSNDRLNDEEFERAITPRSPPVTSTSSVTVRPLSSSPLPTTITKPNPNQRKSSDSTSLPSSPCTNAIIKNAPKRISSPINIKKKESQPITSENDHVETISIDPKDDIKIEINDNDENNPNGTEEIFATDQDINNGQQISGFTMNLGPMNQGIRFKRSLFYWVCNHSKAVRLY